MLSERIEGWLGPTSYNPLHGYPAPGFDEEGEGFERSLNNPIAAGIYEAITDSDKTIHLYCVDVRTQTQAGTRYVANPWTRQSIPNLGYVATILKQYYPAVNEPAAAASDAERAAAVQTAIWFFTNRMVVDEASTLYPLVRDIVDKVISVGPSSQPPMPSISITGPSRGIKGKVLGPFVVRATPVNYTIEVAGAEIFSDAAGTRGIGNGSRLRAGNKIYLRSNSGSATIKVKGTAVVLPGTQVIYAPAEAAPSRGESNAGLARSRIFTAQAMVLADNTEVSVEATSPIRFLAGALPSSPGTNTPGLPNGRTPGAPTGGGGLPLTGPGSPAIGAAGLAVTMLGLLAVVAAGRRRRDRTTA